MMVSYCSGLNSPLRHPCRKRRLMPALGGDRFSSHRSFFSLRLSFLFRRHMTLAVAVPSLVQSISQSVLPFKAPYDPGCCGAYSCSINQSINQASQMNFLLSLKILEDLKSRSTIILKKKKCNKEYFI